MPSTDLQQVVRDVSSYLILLILISTLGPLQFGFHLVRYSFIHSTTPKICQNPPTY